MNYNDAKNYMELFDANGLPPRFRTNFPLCKLFSIKEWKNSIDNGPLVFSIDVPCVFYRLVLYVFLLFSIDPWSSFSSRCSIFLNQTNVFLMI